MSAASIRPEQRRGSWVMPAAMMAIGVAAFVAVAADVVYHGRLAGWDDPVNAWLHRHSEPWAVVACAAIGMLGDLRVMVALAAVVGGALAMRRRRRELAVWFSALLGSAAINSLLKQAFQVPRPTEHTFFIFEPYPGYSFPSGHTMGVTIAAGTLAMLVGRLWPMSGIKRWAVAAAAAGVGLLESFALLYVGVHTLTDVLGALAVSLAWLGVLRWLLPPLGTTPPLR